MSRKSRVRSRSPKAALGLVVAALVTVFLPAVASSVASAAPKPAAPTQPVATSLLITSLDSIDFTAPTGVPSSSVPASYIVKNQSFQLDVAFFAPNLATSDPFDTMPAPLSTTGDTTLKLTVLKGNEDDLAKTWTEIVPKNETAWTFDQFATQKFAGEWDNAQVLVSTVPKKRTDPVLSDDIVFDILIVSGTANQTGLTSITRAGASTTGCSPDATDQVCADLILADGVAQSTGLLSLGACDSAEKCAGQLVQVLIGLNADRQNPATLVMKCDKSLCPGGAISSYELYFTQSADALPTTPAPPCPAKGIVGPEPQTFCVDYVQSTRSNAGDTFLYLLFIEDAKIRFP